MTAPDDVRARFEAAMRRLGHSDLDRDGDGYLWPTRQAAWEGYRAAHADLSGEVRELVDELANDLEAELEAKRGAELDRRIDRDLDVVRRARTMLAKFHPTKEKP